MIPAKFRVTVRQEANDLTGSVEVIALTASAAKALTLLRFFPGWKVVATTKIKELP